MLTLKRSPICKRRRPRRGASLDKAYVRFIHQHCFCVICGRAGPDGAHTQNGGTSMKGPDSSRAPLCRIHHQEYDAGRRTFQQNHEIDMRWVAAATYARYRASKGEKR